MTHLKDERFSTEEKEMEQQEEHSAEVPEKEENPEELIDATASEQDNEAAEEDVLSPEQEQLQQLQSELEEWKNKALRTQADLENVRRRSREEKEKAAKYRSQELVEALLPVLDNFERAISAEPEGDEAASLHQGVQMVYSQLKAAVEKEGLEAVKTEGELFDPHLHQAVMQVEEEGFESNQIVEELQKGYLLKDKVIRPAMVKVNA
ncbi:nucleotide exchange factor GrpE [Alteribacillus sp. HJP-4]|uniref:nucleotide exchange factor GrpE n=1 Tax=Alteribacillus sp. HJP-4 TaxID=2775394 RepID=UPI0035CD13B8